jgi:archaeosine synthase beta-subunit
MCSSAAQDNRHLAEQLGSLARAVRKTTIAPTVDYRLPQLAEEDDFFFEGRLLRRKRVLLLSRGCTLGTCTMCPLPNEAILAPLRPPTAEELISQFDAAFTQTPLDEFEVINVYTNGNFFSEKELPLAARRHVFARVRESRAEALMVESLPQFIRAQTIVETKEQLGQKRLIACVGLESANDIVRELCVNSPCRREAFERVVGLLRQAGFVARVFLMLKPPFLTEREAIEDVIESARYLAKLDLRDPTICPARVAPGTIAHMLFAAGAYRPPWLWSVAEVLRRTQAWCAPRIAASNLYLQRNPGSISAANCDACSARCITAIERFNSARDLSGVEELTCGCYAEYLQYLQQEQKKHADVSIPERVAGFLETVNMQSSVHREG